MAVWIYSPIIVPPSKTIHDSEDYRHFLPFSPKRRDCPFCTTALTEYDIQDLARLPTQSQRHNQLLGLKTKSVSYAPSGTQGSGNLRRNAAAIRLFELQIRR